MEWTLGDHMYELADEQPKRTQRVHPDAAVERATDESVDASPAMEPGSAMGSGDEMIRESASVDAASETRFTSELSMQLHGVSHPDALYRAAGGGQPIGGAATFACPCCGRAVGRVIRVRATKASAWQAVCAMCAAATLAKHPNALIGGLVRANRRRRRTAARTLRNAG